MAKKGKWMSEKSNNTLWYQRIYWSPYDPVMMILQSPPVMSDRGRGMGVGMNLYIFIFMQW